MEAEGSQGLRNMVGREALSETDKVVMVHAIMQAGIQRPDLIHGLAAPKGVPDDIMNKLKETLAAVMKEAAIKGMLKNMGNTPIYKNAEEFGIFAKRMEGVYERIAKAGNISMK